MNGHQRITAALKGERSDTVPVMLHNFLLAAAEANVSMAQFRSDPQVASRVFIEAAERYQLDGVVIDIDTATLAGAVGVPIDFPEHEPARCHGGSLSELAAVDDLAPVDVAKYEGVQVWLETTRLVKQHFGDEVYVRGNCDQCPFALASMMRTPQEWMMDLINPGAQDLVVQLLNYCTNITKQFLRLMIDTGADMVSNGDSPAGPSMISPQMYKQYAWPYEKHIVDFVHEHKQPYLLHICGDTSVILDEMIATGADCLELDYQTDVNQAFEKMRSRTVFVGNIDPSGVLALGTVDDVRRATRELLDLFADTPRLILNAGCAIPASTPSKNLQAMIDTARSG